MGCPLLIFARKSMRYFIFTVKFILCTLQFCKTQVKETLKIVYVTPGDEGEYVCTAVNDRGVEEKSSAIIIGNWV